MSKSIHPWLNQAYQRCGSLESIPDGIWAHTANKPSDGAMNSVLLSFAELDFGEIAETTLPFEGVSSFDEWVTHFNPKTMGDWLMVPKLFLIHLRTGRNLPALTSTPDPWIDAVLRQSRGMLMWSHQFIEIIRMIADVGINDANQILSNWVLRKPEIKQTLGNIHYPPSQQTLLQIIEERTVGMEYLGSQDYFFADWLVRYYHSATNAVCVEEAR